MASYISVDLRNQVRACDRDRCCYCKTSEALSGIRMAFDHIHPRSKGGETCFENVGLACRSCNEFKGNSTTGQDLLAQQTEPLFNPRLQDWHQHFAWSDDGTRVEGVTAVGRATVVALQMNNAAILATRKRWVSVVGVLGRAIAAYRERRDLLRCAGDLAGAVAAVNCDLEQLERAAQDRVGLAAAVDRLVGAIGRTVGREQQKLEVPKPPKANSREQLLARWEHYSAGLPAASLELLVAQRALRDGCSAKEVTLMLVAGSKVVRQIHDVQGRKEAMVRDRPKGQRFRSAHRENRWQTKTDFLEPISSSQNSTKGRD